MAQFLPQLSQVIRYTYWSSNEARVGREHGVKDRSCGVILTRTTNAGNTIAYVLPITHTRPLKDECGLDLREWETPISNGFQL
jgi:hypothetical protein